MYISHPHIRDLLRDGSFDAASTLPEAYKSTVNRPGEAFSFFPDRKISPFLGGLSLSPSPRSERPLSSPRYSQKGDSILMCARPFFSKKIEFVSLLRERIL